MKTIIALAAVVVVTAGTTGRAAQRLTVAPTAMETFAALPDAKTTWSKLVGRLDGGIAYAVVSAVALTSPGSTPATMRGIRIELRHEGVKPSCDLMHTEWAVFCDRDPAVVYLEESRLAAVRDAVLRGSAEVHPGHTSGITYYRSSGSSGSGILVFGYSLIGRTLEEFASLMTDAETALKNAPR